VIAHGGGRTTRDVDLLVDDDADADAESLDLEGVAIPIASKPTLIRTKQTVRPSDLADRQFLQRLIDEDSSPR
jgi:hypothetical protein